VNLALHLKFRWFGCDHGGLGREIVMAIVCKLDRLARSTRELLETMETICEAGARFQPLSAPWANTITHAGKLIMTVFEGIAEFERDLIRERTSAGREAARRRGIHFGRPRKLNPEQAKLARRLVDEGKSVTEVVDTFNVHTATIYRLSGKGEMASFGSSNCARNAFICGDTHSGMF
jgi:DNA invertase Pin-like site-specific DNA recombinase